MGTDNYRASSLRRITRGIRDDYTTARVHYLLARWQLCDHRPRIDDVQGARETISRRRRVLRRSGARAVVAVVGFGVSQRTNEIRSRKPTRPYIVSIVP